MINSIKLGMGTACQRAKALISKIDRPFLDRFFKGRVYPAIVAFITVLGHITGLEYYLNIPNMLLLCLGLWVSDTVRPAIVYSCTVVFQISIKNTPGLPTFSLYYFTPFKLTLLLILTGLLVVSLVRFIIVNRIFCGLSVKKTPLILPLCLLSASFILAGAFSSGWRISDLVYGIAEALTFSFIFLLFYQGLKKESAKDSLSYFTYFSALLSLILICEMAHLYITGEVILDGRIVQEKVLLGWGIWNTVGVWLAVLIPMCFLGVVTEREKLLYFILATLNLITVFMTLSRNAILFGGAVYVLCVVLLCFFGERKKLFRIVTLAGIVVCAAAVFVFWDKISSLFVVLLNKGFSDNGRFELWQHGIENFLKAPIFGNGFYSFEQGSMHTTNFLPKLAHQTFVQILSAMGIFGLACYLFYRARTLVPFIKKPSFAKTLLLFSVLVLLGESLLDNFIFHFIHTFHYSFAIALAFRLCEDEENDNISL